jgi:hypothetical protein
MQQYCENILQKSFLTLKGVSMNCNCSGVRSQVTGEALDSKK